MQKSLISMGEKEYREFSSKLIPTVDKSKVIGIRIPFLRKHAKSLENYESFLNELPHKYFEENNLHAFLIEREQNFDKKHLTVVANIKSNEYYINMMRAWYFATALAKRYEETLPYIEKKVLDVWTHNKTIQKATESLRISKEKK